MPIKWYGNTALDTQLKAAKLVEEIERNRKHPVLTRSAYDVYYHLDPVLDNFVDLVITCLKESRTYQKCLEKAVAAKISQKKLEIKKLEEEVRFLS